MTGLAAFITSSKKACAEGAMPLLSHMEQVRKSIAHGNSLPDTSRKQTRAETRDLYIIKRLFPASQLERMDPHSLVF